MEAGGEGAPSGRRSFGDWSMDCARAAFRNPAITVAITTAVLFLVARIPTQIFYSRLGTTPEDAGLNSVQVLLEGTAGVFLVGLGLALVYAVLVAVLSVVQWTAFRLLPGEPGRTLGQQLREMAKAGAVLVPAGAIVFAGVILTFEAVRSSNEVRVGEKPQLELAPWSAWPTEVHWEPTATRIRLPGCEALFYLGEGGGHIVLYDSAAHATYRIDSDLIQTNFPQRCG